MRSDLNRGCEACRLRLPSSQATCPNCGKATGAAALLSKGEKRDIDRAARNLLLGAPALAGILLSLPLGLAVFLESPTTDFGAGWIGMAPIAILAGAVGVMLGLAAIWCVWGVLAWLGILVVRPSRFAAVEVGVEPFPPARARLQRLDGLLGLVDYVEQRGKRFLAAGIVLWWLAQVVAELIVAPDHILGQGPGILITMAAIAFGELVGLALLAVPFMGALWAFDASLSATVNGAATLRAAFRRRPRTATAPPTLKSGREEVAGSVATAESVMAPLSGTPCAAFRIVGVVDGFAVDDGAAGALSIAGAAGREVFRAQIVAVDVDPGQHPRALDAAACERLRTFLGARGLSVPVTEASVAEGLVLDGDAVRVWAARGSDVEGGDGYRDDARRVLDDSDGMPALLTVPPRT